MFRTLFVASLCFPSLAMAMMAWTPSVDSREQHGPGGGHAAHGRPAGRGMMLSEGEGAKAYFWLPTLERSELSLKDSVAAIKPSGVDNYHLLYAVRETSELHETALRYHYMNGRPSNRSPSDLVQADKAPLEIVPNPLPREHARYTSERPAAFLVRYQGKPLADQPIVLESSNGTRWFTKTDNKGNIVFHQPSDFQHIGKGRDNNPPADFVVHTRHVDGGREYRTSLSAPYYVNPRHWQSFEGGLWATLAGFIAGLGILQVASRRSVAQNKKG